MAFKAYSVEILTRFCHDLFETFGFTRGEAEQITDVLLLADLYGIRSHGVQRLIRYHRSITRGCVKVNARPEVVFETPVSAVIDGNAGDIKELCRKIGITLTERNRLCKLGKKK